MPKRINNPESCVCCARRSNGLAVGRPGQLGWCCEDCSTETAKKALNMDSRSFDTLEKLVAERVAKDAADGPVTLTPEEMPEFVQWVVTHFADTIRKHVEQGGSPF